MEYSMHGRNEKYTKHFCGEGNDEIINCMKYSFVLNGCETWSLTLKKKHVLRVFENRVLRKNIWPEDR
jgi:hypothetical protein